MSRPISLAVVGATGLVGEALLEQLAESGLTFSDVYAVASGESAGKRIEFGDRLLKVAALEQFDFSSVEVALFAVPPAVSLENARRAADQGALVLDLSGVWLAEPSVPVCCPGVTPLDPEQLQQHRLLSVLTGPAAVLAEISNVLVPASLQSVVATSLMPASMGGRAALEDLARQTARLLNSQDPEPSVFPAQAAFSLLSAGTGSTGSSALAAAQSVQLAVGRLPVLGHLSASISACWVPAFFGAGLAVDLTFSEQVPAALAAQLLEDAGLPVDAVEQPREPRSLSADLPQSRPLIAFLANQGGDIHRLVGWVGYENVRFGAAHKGVQILQLLIKDYL